MTGREWTTLALALALGGVPLALGAPQEASLADEVGESQAWMGVFLGDAVDGGVHISAVVPGSPAERAGLVSGDVLVQVDGLHVLGVRDLTSLLARSRPGTGVELRLLRSGDSVRCTVELAERPSSTALLRRVAPIASPAPRAPRPPAAPGIARAQRAGRAAYGLVLTDVTSDLRRHFGAPEGAGVLVTGVAAGRPAARDGFRVGDVLVLLGGKPVRAVEDVEQILGSRRDGAIAASLVRAGRAEVVTVRGSLDAVLAQDAVEASGESMAGVTLKAAQEEYAAAKAARDRAVRLEIERLEKRIERLKRQLESGEAGSGQ
jgi:predicted metalloprotease with PDZ domain